MGYFDGYSRVSTHLRTCFLIFCVGFSAHVQAITNDDLFAYAESVYSGYFSGTPSAGAYLNYSYRYYQDTGNYLAVDPDGGVYIYGPISDYEIYNVGTLDLFENEVVAWQASNTSSGQTGSLIGTWKFTSSFGTETFTFTQIGSYGGLYLTNSNNQTIIGATDGSRLSFDASPDPLDMSSTSYVCAVRDANTIDCGRYDSRYWVFKNYRFSTGYGVRVE